jgi:hypothetical protein
VACRDWRAEAEVARSDEVRVKGSREMYNWREGNGEHHAKPMAVPKLCDTIILQSLREHPLTKDHG